jgi:cell division septum initiation protein DivIVA
VYRVFETLDALVTVVEEARGLPMTANCVVPRGDVLELLDELREALPGEVDDAQDVLDHRDELMSTAERRADEVTEQAEQDAEKVLGDARHEAERLMAQAAAAAEDLLGRARHEAEATVADARAQHQDLLDAVRAEAARLSESARVDHERSVAEGRAEQARLVARTEVVQAAHVESGRIIDAGEREAARLRAECDQYISSALAGFEDTLSRTLQTVRRGRDRQPARPTSADSPDRLGSDLI